MKDPRQIRKEEVLNDMRNELQEIARFKRSPEGKKAFMVKWMDDNFGKRKRGEANEQIQTN